MLKIKEWFKNNHVYLTLGLSALVAGLIAYFGFEKGVQETDRSKKEAEINSLKVMAENSIIKEKSADEKKSIYEISEDIDGIIDRK